MISMVTVAAFDNEGVAVNTSVAIVIRILQLVRERIRGDRTVVARGGEQCSYRVADEWIWDTATRPHVDVSRSKNRVPQGEAGSELLPIVRGGEQSALGWEPSDLNGCRSQTYFTFNIGAVEQNFSTSAQRHGSPHVKCNGRVVHWGDIDENGGGPIGQVWSPFVRR